jgi:adenine/guanine phosphoribosyltransferase-like PRPP-binding protein
MPLLTTADFTLYRDRADAGRRLAERLAHLRDEQPVVAGLPRGGVPVAFEVASALHAPLDVVVVRKLGVPVSRATSSNRSSRGSRRSSSAAGASTGGTGHRSL